MEFDAKQQAEFVSQITSHQTAIRAYIISLMPGVSGTWDVLQETNILLWEKRRKFEPGTNFKAWAFAVARLKVKAYRRKLLRLGRPMLDEDLADHLAELVDEAPAEIDERLMALNKCLGRLDEDHRQLVEHRHLSGGSLEEFSKKSGRSVNSITVTLCRLRAALRKCINHEMNVSRFQP